MPYLWTFSSLLSIKNAFKGDGEEALERLDSRIHRFKKEHAFAVIKEDKVTQCRLECPKLQAFFKKIMYIVSYHDF